MISLIYKLFTIVFLFGLMAIPPAFANELIAIYPDNTMFQTAVPIPNNLGESYFTVEEFEREGQSHWYSFVGINGQQVLIQTLIPDLPSTSDNPAGFTPCFDLLIGEDKVTPTSMRVAFFEPVTNTKWFITCEVIMTLPSDGLYYIRAHDELGHYEVGDLGKFSLAFGEGDSLDFFDWLQVPFWILVVNQFYENYTFVWMMLVFLFIITVTVFYILSKRNKK